MTDKMYQLTVFLYIMLKYVDVIYLVPEDSLYFYDWSICQQLAAGRLQWETHKMRKASHRHNHVPWC